MKIDRMINEGLCYLDGSPLKVGDIIVMGSLHGEHVLYRYGHIEALYPQSRNILVNYGDGAKRQKWYKILKRGVMKINLSIMLEEVNCALCNSGKMDICVKLSKRRENVQKAIKKSMAA